MEEGGPATRRQSQRARRRMSGRRSGSGNDTLVQAAAAAAAASIQFDEGEPTQNLPHQGEAMPPPTQEATNRTSWYNDAMMQSVGGEDISAMLGQEQAPPPAEQPQRSDEDEVLEQYRIMAHVEANIRVKDNTGFDMDEYEKRRKLQPEPVKGEYYTGASKPKPKLPEPRSIQSMGGLSSTSKPEEPPLPPPRPNRRFLDPNHGNRRVPDTCPGVRGPPGEGEHAVRCLGCHNKLKVSIQATLVSCPDCSTVSPATSTRR